MEEVQKEASHKGYSSSRTKSREASFALLFEYTFKEDGTPLSELIEGKEEQADEFTCKLTAGTLKYIDELDEKINRYSTQWKKERLPRVVLSVLRLAIYEMLHEESIPLSVSINEAVLITKTYASQEDAAYVNGILRSVFNELQSEKAPEANTETTISDSSVD